MNTVLISLLYAKMHSSTSISSRPSIIAISLSTFNVVQLEALRYIPASACAGNDIKHFARLEGSKTFDPAYMVKSVYKPFNDVEGR